MIFSVIFSVICHHACRKKVEKLVCFSTPLTAAGSLCHPIRAIFTLHRIGLVCDRQIGDGQRVDGEVDDDVWVLRTAGDRLSSSPRQPEIGTELDRGTFQGTMTGSSGGRDAVSQSGFANH